MNEQELSIFFIVGIGVILVLLKIAIHYFTNRKTGN
jgi:hypothetical protein